MAITNYSLLEICESPLRLRAMEHMAIFDLAREASEKPERFYTYINGLKNHHPWAYVSLYLACSDMVPLKSMFKLALSHVVMHNYNNGSSSLVQFYNQLLTHLRSGRFTNEEFRVKFLKKAEENLTSDDLNVFLTVFKQENMDAIKAGFKRLYDDGFMDDNIKPFFSFTYKDRDVTTAVGNDITNLYVAFKGCRRYIKCFTLFFDEKGKEYIPKKDVISVMKLAQPNVRYGKDIPEIGFVYLSTEDLPVLFATYNDFYTLSRYKSIKQKNSLTNDISNGCRYLVEVDSEYSVISFSSFENKVLTTKTLNAEGVKYVSFPYLGDTINVLLVDVKPEKANKDKDVELETLTVILPSEFEKKNYKVPCKIEVTQYKDQYFLPTKL